MPSVKAFLHEASEVITRHEKLGSNTKNSLTNKTQIRVGDLSREVRKRVCSLLEQP